MRQSPLLPMKQKIRATRVQRLKPGGTQHPAMRSLLTARRPATVTEGSWSRRRLIVVP